MTLPNVTAGTLPNLSTEFLKAAARFWEANPDIPEGERQKMVLSAFNEARFDVQFLREAAFAAVKPAL